GLLHGFILLGFDVPRQSLSSTFPSAVGTTSDQRLAQHATHLRVARNKHGMEGCLIANR
ncbi:MAG: hypothetical protein ACI89E_001703, partial [Planctomycetota bacterium]